MRPVANDKDSKMKPFKAFLKKARVRAKEVKKQNKNITPGLHFVGFNDNAYHRAAKIFGYPAHVHRLWDKRAKDDVAPGDKVVFHSKKEWDRHQRNEPSPWAHNDSENF